MCPRLLAAGAGKTSLLNALAGKAASYGVQTGVVLVNGRPDRLERYKRVMGFVPQVSWGAGASIKTGAGELKQSSKCFEAGCLAVHSTMPRMPRLPFRAAQDDIMHSKLTVEENL